jgi:hypothetical protein
MAIIQSACSTISQAARQHAALVLALTLEHPSIESPDDPWTSGPPTLRRAHRLAHAARRLRHDLDAYRLALHRALGVDHEPPDGLPF